MRILHVVTSTDKVLTERPILNLMKSLEFQGVERTLLCLNTDFDSSVPNLEILNKTCNLDSSSDVIRIISLALKESGAEVLHIHDMGILRLSLMASRKFKVKCILTLYTTSPVRISLMDRLCVDKIIVNSEFAKKGILTYNRLFSEKVHVILKGIDIERFDVCVRNINNADLRKFYGISESSFIVGSVGSLIPSNDFETLIKSFSNVRKKEMDAVLLIVGKGSEKDNIEKLAKVCNVFDSIKIIDSDEYESFLYLFDTFIVSSYAENYLISILGAMAASKPVIATKIGANPEMIIQGKTGFLVPCGFPERIDNVIMRWHANPRLAKDVGLAGRKYLEEEFGLVIMGKRYKELYESL